MSAVKQEIHAHYPGIFVHSIRIGGDENADRMASIYDNMNRQVLKALYRLIWVDRRGVRAAGRCGGAVRRL